MTPFALNALRPTTAVPAVKPSLMGDANTVAGGGNTSASQRGPAFAQLLTQHQTTPLSRAAQTVPSSAPAPAKQTPTAAAPEHRAASAAHAHPATARSADGPKPERASASDSAERASSEDSSTASDEASSETSATDSPAAHAGSARGTARGAKGMAHARPATGTARTPSQHDPDDSGLTAKGSSDAAKPADVANNPTPLATLLPGWTPPTVPGSPSASPGSSAASDLTASTATAGDPATTTGAAGSGGLNGVDSPNDPRAHHARPTEDTRDAAIALPGSTTVAQARDAAQALPALAAQTLGERDSRISSPQTGSAPLGDFASQLAQLGGTSASAPGSSAAAPVDVQVMTPATAPEFPEAVGVQVSLLAQDGVQHAELHLNPPEMGPISVRIAIDGQQAQIDFGADSAQTRDLLEAGLPELASALRDAGLTLSGGGVSQHPQPQQGGREAGDNHAQGGNRERAGSTHRTGADNDAASALTPLSAAQTRSLARRAAGGIDAYA